MHDADHTRALLGVDGIKADRSLSELVTAVNGKRWQVVTGCERLGESPVCNRLYAAHGGSPLGRDGFADGSAWLKVPFLHGLAFIALLALHREVLSAARPGMPHERRGEWRDVAYAIPDGNRFMPSRNLHMYLPPEQLGTIVQILRESVRAPAPPEELMRCPPPPGLGITRATS